MRFVAALLLTAALATAATDATAQAAVPGEPTTAIAAARASADQTHA